MGRRTTLDCRHSRAGAAGYIQASLLSENKESLDAAPCRALGPLPPMPARTSQSTKKLGKNYYMVRRPSSGECSVVPKKVANDFVMVGKAPYASEQYAKAAIETFPECKSEARNGRQAVAGCKVRGPVPLDYP